MSIQISSESNMFIYFRNPTPDNSLGLTWPEYEASGRQFVDIGDELTAGADLDADVYEFWKGIFKFAGVDF